MKNRPLMIWDGRFFNVQQEHHGRFLDCQPDKFWLVFRVNCARDIAGNIRAMKNGSISQDDFSNALENTINISGEKLRAISDDRAALAYAAYLLSLENGYGSQSFPFLAVLDGMCALLDNVRTTDFYEINLRCEISSALSALLEKADHIIVYNNRCRLPENADPGKTYFGDVSLANGSYEIHRDLKGGISLIIPKPVPKDRLNVIPFNESAEFSLKVSYKASELSSEHQNGEYVTRLMAENPVTFHETTMSGNSQYCVYAGDVWVGTIFDDPKKRVGSSQGNHANAYGQKVRASQHSAYRHKNRFQLIHNIHRQGPYRTNFDFRCTGKAC